MKTPGISPHYRKMADTWGSTGLLQDEISRSISDAIEHGIRLLDPKPGERILDLGCGTGWTARSIWSKSNDLQVHGIDISERAIESARDLAQRAGMTIRFDVGEAESLPFADASFDAAISTFGVMFAGDPAAVVKELKRVCRKGGRFVNVAWQADEFSWKWYCLFSPEGAEKGGSWPGRTHRWADQVFMRELFEPDFKLIFEEGVSRLQAPSAEALWDMWARSHGPLRGILDSLGETQQEQVRNGALQLLEEYAADGGISLRRHYLVALAKRI